MWLLMDADVISIVMLYRLSVPDGYCYCICCGLLVPGILQSRFSCQGTGGGGLFSACRTLRRTAVEKDVQGRACACILPLHILFDCGTCGGAVFRVLAVK